MIKKKYLKSRQESFLAHFFGIYVNETYQEDSCLNGNSMLVTYFYFFSLQNVEKPKDQEQSFQQ